MTQMLWMVQKIRPNNLYVYSDIVTYRLEPPSVVLRTGTGPLSLVLPPKV